MSSVSIYFNEIFSSRSWWMVVNRLVGKLRWKFVYEIRCCRNRWPAKPKSGLCSRRIWAIIIQRIHWYSLIEAAAFTHSHSGFLVLIVIPSVICWCIALYVVVFMPSIGRSVQHKMHMHKMQMRWMMASSRELTVLVVRSKCFVLMRGTTWRGIERIK